jgi:predicted ATPase
MPITSIQLRNFRCFSDSGTIPIRPLTIIFGRNNAGKSSILNSLFLLRQTLDRPEYEEGLNMRGPLYAAGGYSDIVHKHKSRENVSMVFGLRSSREALWRSGQLSLFPRSKSESTEVAGEITLEFSSAEPRPPRLVRFRAQSPTTPVLEIRRGRGRGGPYELWIGGKVVSGERDWRFPSGFLPYIPRFAVHAVRSSPKRADARRLASLLAAELRLTFLNLRAVGAFRTAPERRYDYQGRPPDAADLSGANVVYALIDDTMRRGKERGSLLNSVNQWLKSVGRVRLMGLRRISPTARLYEVRVKDVDSGRWANFSDVGFGIGQALPVLVEGLRTPRGGLFIVEEPEIHLHPDAQLAMADYLVDLSASGRTVIAETHSEALLLRVRKAVAEAQERRGGRVKLPPDHLSILYVQSHGDGTSDVRALRVDELGQVEGWPEGFMNEVTDERLELLGTMTRRSKR